VKRKLKFTKIDKTRVEVILAAVKPVLSSDDYMDLKQTLTTFIWLQDIIREKSISMLRLSQMLFGKRTESMQNLKNRVKEQEGSAGSTAGSNSSKPQSENQSSPSDDEQGTSSPKESIVPQGSTSSQASASSQEGIVPQKGSSPKGHGRKPLEAYDVTKLIHISHDKLEPGQVCPLCSKGRLYQVDPQVLILVKGQPPLEAEAYSAQGLRCNLCGQVFRATFPAEVSSQPKADISARAMVCLAKYQLGTPLYRLESWLKFMKVPISDAEMWEWTESVALVLYPVHRALREIAARGHVIHNDDTKGRVLELMKENCLAEQKEKQTEIRKGIFASCLLSKTELGHQVAIYVTGRKNSGENLDSLLDLRPECYSKPIQVCDGSSQNTTERHETDIVKCLQHARHNFCEIVEVWPNEALTVIGMLNTVFMNDRQTKDMSTDQRLKLHQKKSAPVLKELKKYCKRLLKKKVVEPNSSFGKAINYLNNHWEGLTFFLKNGLAPISNNDDERCIKSYVLIRKNSYFYKSYWGAMVGDILLSMTRTCELNGINSYDYLVALQANAEAVEKNPTAWLPWNYTQNSSAPRVKVHFAPEEEVYYRPATGPPKRAPAPAQPNLEEQKMSLREKARAFFKSHYARWREKMCPA
jgi:transposase